MEKWEWAWLAGIFEGEGYLDIRGPWVRARIGMTDRDVIETINRLCPSPRGLRTREFSYKKTLYMWERGDREEVRYFLEGVLPYLHERRGLKAKEALRALEGNPGAKRKRTMCNRGHPLSGENLYIARTSGSRSCRTCRRLRDSWRSKR